MIRVQNGQRLYSLTLPQPVPPLTATIRQKLLSPGVSPSPLLIDFFPGLNNSILHSLPNLNDLDEQLIEDVKRDSLQFKYQTTLHISVQLPKLRKSSVIISYLGLFKRPQKRCKVDPTLKRMDKQLLQEVSDKNERFLYKKIKLIIYC